MTFTVIYEEDCDFGWSYHNIIAICDSDEAAERVLESLDEELAARVEIKELQLNQLNPDYNDQLRKESV